MSNYPNGLASSKAAAEQKDGGRGADGANLGGSAGSGDPAENV